MPFNNDIAGGNGQLVRNWIQSVNYVAGSSGWRISKNGNAEFNNGTFRGSIEVGPIPGQHFIVNNPATGDVVDIYDGTNTLVTKIDKFGEIISTNTANNSSVQIFGSGYLFTNLSSPPSSLGGMTGNSSSVGSEVIVDSGHTVGGKSAGIFFLDDITGPGGKAALVAQQRGMSQGVLIQTDNFSATNNYFHAQLYTNIVTDASGNSNFAHNCNFTPTMGFLVSASTAGSDFYQYVWLNPAFGPANANAHFTDRLGAPKVTTTLAMTYGLFIG